MSLESEIQKRGRLPPVGLNIIPLDDGTNRNKLILPKLLASGDVAAGFTQYQYDQNMLIPSDSFSFSFASPNDRLPYDLIKEGDETQVLARDQLLATGFIDGVELNIDSHQGEIVSIHGRDMLGHLEDQSAINENNTPFYAKSATIHQVVTALVKNTRMEKRGLILSQAPEGSYLFQSEPGESKLSALLRFLEPLNCLVWCGANGEMIIGRPSFYVPPQGLFYLIKSRRQANILRARVVRNGTQIPSVIIPLFSGQEIATNAVAAQQQVFNTATSPVRLRKAGHFLTKATVVSHPSGFDANYVNTINIFNQSQGQTTTQIESNNKAGQALFIQQWAKREIAKKNMEELLVDIDVPGHYDISGRPYRVDTTWSINIERGGVDETMYCYAVKYRLEPGHGQTTSLSFCRLNTIVSDTIAP